MKSVLRLVVGSILLALLSIQNCWAVEYFISPTGNDNNDGLSTSTPFLSLNKALLVCVKGDIINVGSGTYMPGSSIVSKDSIVIRGVFSTAATRPVFDYSNSTGSYGIRLRSNKCHIYGIIIKKAADNGFVLDIGSYNKIEFCDFLENGDSGFQIKGGAHHNKIINCDSYYNYDPPTGGNSDGFANKLDQGGNNSFRGCRAWQNSDDGWDGYVRPQSHTNFDTLYNCWCYRNGYIKDGTAKGNGNGFKLGGYDANTTPTIHNQILFNCLSVKNKSKGFDQNNNVGTMIMYNCTAYGNVSRNYGFEVNTTGDLILKNCVSLGTTGGFNTKAQLVTNSWQSPFSVSSDDFLSLDDTQMTLPRKDDGSLPDMTFMHLTEDSDLVDAGTDVGLPYVDLPDLGCFEKPWPTGLLEKKSQEMEVAFYPNPAKNKVYMKNGNYASATLVLYNSFGIVMQQKQMGSEMDAEAFDLSGYKPGMYVAHVVVQGKTNVYPILLNE